MVAGCSRLRLTSMVVLPVTTPDPALNRAWARLLVAVALSLTVHLVLLLEIPINPTGGVPDVVSTINARLEAASEMPAETAVEPPLPDVTPDATPDKSTIVDPLADPVAKKPEPKPAPKQAVAAPPAAPNSGVEVPLIRDPTYYTAKQLDVIPKPLTPIQLYYPETAVANHIFEGNLLLLLLIDEFGVVTEVSVIEAQPAGYFEEAARSVFRPSRWSPAMIGGRAVKSRWQVRVRYVPDESPGAIR